VAVPCTPNGLHNPFCPCGASLPPSGGTSSLQQLLHRVQWAFIQMQGSGCSRNVEVLVSGSDLVDKLKIGCMAEVVLRCSPKQPKCPAPLVKVAHTLEVMNATLLPIHTLRGHQLQRPLQAAETDSSRSGSSKPVQELMNLLATATGFSHGRVKSVTWYMLLSVLLSAVAVGEEQRASKLSGHKEHRCQVKRPTRFGKAELSKLISWQC
jgi:hypothetical protein